MRVLIIRLSSIGDIILTTPVLKQLRERREQPKQKTNPSMITSTKNYTKKKPKTKRTDRTLHQMVKAKIYRENHTKKHTHTHSQKEGD